MQKFYTFVVSFFIVCLCPGQEMTDYDYWMERYLSVSFPVHSIKINSKYGFRTDPINGKKRHHNGLDIQAKFEDVVSMFDGVVVKVGKDSRSGIYATLKYGNYEVSYCHLDKLCIRQGDFVIAGDVIGISGNTGRSTGPHLHITAKHNGQSIDPYQLLLYVRNVKRESYIALGGKIDDSSCLSPEAFIEKYAPLAMEQQRKYGIPSSVILSQMAYESKWGMSNLAVKGNNFFGIKATSKWKVSKPYSYHDDDKNHEAFCNYRSVNESIEHYSRILMSDRYKSCRNFSSTDYHNWLISIKKAGYATAKDYVHKCERIIHQYRLDVFDEIATM